MENEIWKDIEGYEGRYQVSNLGRVRSLDRYITKPHPRNGVPTKYFKRGTLMAKHIMRNGYIGLTIKVGGKPKNYMVHRLVAKAFVPGYFENADVNHKDCNRQNNRADNLEWMTRRDNLKYSNGDTASAIEQIHRSQRKPIIQMTMEGEFIREWPSIHSAHLALGLDSKSISGACHQNYGNKTCGGFRWKFKE